MGKPPLHLLLVEDEPAHAAAIRHAFETGEAETQIEVVRTLEEFRRHSAGHTPDLALLDLNLPDGKAVEVLSHPPEDGPFPIIVMTSYGSERLAVQAIKSGALDYVVKSRSPSPTCHIPSPAPCANGRCSPKAGKPWPPKRN